MLFFFSSRRRHTRWPRDWSSDVCSSDLEAEIAQNRGAFGQQPVNYWIHNNMVTIDGAKMSKSAGNFINLEELFEGDHDKLKKGYSPMVIRFLILQSHYRSTIDFSNDALEAAERGLARLMTAADLLEKIGEEGFSKAEGSQDGPIADAISACFQSMNDDCNK